MSERRQLSLNLFIYPGGHHEAAWRYKASAADRILDVTYYQELAQRAEAHKFDAVFFADGPALADNVRYAQRFRIEPITLLSAIAVATKRIGLIATASTTYTEPYNLARLFASLDHISSGRAGWNIVTTTVAASGAEFRPARTSPAWRAIRARQGISGCHHAAVGQLGGRRCSSTIPRRASLPIPARSTRSTTSAKHFRVRGPLNISRVAARQAGLCAGRLIRRRPRLCRALRRGDLYRAPDARQRAGVLCRHQAPGPSLRPQSGPDQDPAGHQPVHRQHAGRGRPAAGRIQRADPAGIFADPAPPDDRRRSLRLSTSTAPSRGI